jgi:hypothetical protein
VYYLKRGVVTPGAFYRQGARESLFIRVSKFEKM